MNMSLIPLNDSNVLSNVSLTPRHDYNVTSESPSVLRSELMILWYNKPVWINELLVNKTRGTCPYNNCFSTTNKALFNQSASVIYLINSGGMPRIPPVSAVHRNKDQTWSCLLTRLWERVLTTTVSLQPTRHCSTNQQA
ncbi:hypothetical protein DPMN_160554 [Dreissena polymorpha]|uniref:Uncharacterized protein n=1 Tax=Dreissena polymorpha TaxID=45954 RepID=A0A9D4EMF9_DREPO|nr:hypothetical protein DPMN_160554 [Dreissena polymorpha]